MSLYSIYVLEYGYVPEYDKSGVIYGAHNEGYVKLPYCYAVIKGKDWAAMVDVGYNDKDYGKYLGNLFNVKDWSPPKDVLAEIGLTPEDIKAVFITHAHFDHFGNVEAFPNATFYIQKKELQDWVWAMSLPDRLRWILSGIDTGDICAAFSSRGTSGSSSSTAQWRTSSPGSTSRSLTTATPGLACGSRSAMTVRRRRATPGCLQGISSINSRTAWRIQAAENRRSLPSCWIGDWKSVQPHHGH